MAIAPAPPATRGLILAAGRGSRMGVSTAHQPKCLTALLGRPLLSWGLEALAAAGVGPVALATGYRAELLAGYADASFENPRWSQTQMVRSLAGAAAWLEAGPCLVAYGDIVYHPDDVRALLQARADLAITYDRAWLALWRARFEDPLSDAEAFRLAPDGRQLAQIGGRAASIAEIEGQYMGLLRFTPAGWASVQAYLASLDEASFDRLDMTSLLAALLARGVAIEAVPVSGRWCEVDHEADAAAYERLLAAGPWTHDWRWSA